MTDDFEELLGPAPSALSEKEGKEALSLDIGAIASGVSVAWLAHVFSMHPNTVKQRLADCPPIRGSWGNRPLFSVKQAAGYLVPPRVDIASWIKKLRPNDLPPYLQSEFWAAQNQRLKYEEAAGDLWRTEKVRDVLAEAFKTIKQGCQLWVDTLERAQELTPKQRTSLVHLVDGLQDDLYLRLVEMPKGGRTPSALSEIETLVPE